MSCARGWGVETTVIPNGVDHDRFASTSDTDRARWRARFGRYVLAVGGIEPRKGSLDLLAAVAGLDVRLVIAGGETLFDYRDYRAEWEARATVLGVAPVVLGPVPDDELPSLVAAADVFAFPSTKEGFGMAAMEALVAGVPLVTRDLPVLREVFGPAAMLADSVPALTDVLARALAAPDPARQEASRALARQYTWDAAAVRHLRLYEELLVATSP